MPLLVNTRNAHACSCQSNGYETKLLLKVVSNADLIEVIVKSPVELDLNSTFTGRILCPKKP